MGQTHGVESGGEGFGDKVSDPSPLNSLPVDCISNIISFTSPQDACVLALVSKTFESAVKSDNLWEKFLPADYEYLVPRSRDFKSKKELYFALCDNHVLIDNGKSRLWLEKASGKRCIMLPAMDLIIAWVDNLHYWHWILIPEARFGRVAVLLSVCWFDICGKTNTRFLSPGTRYTAYIVFKKLDNCKGFEDKAVEAVIEIVGEEPYERIIYLDEAIERNIVKPEKRQDGWMEVELGEFFNEGLHSDEINIRVLASDKLKWKRGLIILGIEIRPAKIHLYNAKNTD
ncbi:F-box protein PP2-B10 [Cardamine amara subsp. amara]|uniref:F-box protein PP2-B10 n=1 Tax=Cardamine amara subsp. amara TaxID=228776 RepID=A0ABD1BMH0_CARAN